MIDHATTSVDDLAQRLDAALAAGRWPRWLSVGLAAEYASLSVVSIRRLISAGKLTPHRVLRGRILLDRLELDSLIDAATGGVRVGRGRAAGTRRARNERAGSGER